MNADELGTLVNRRRVALAITQESLAFTTGVNRRVIGELERGKETVQLGIALRVVEALGLELRAEPRA